MNNNLKSTTIKNVPKTTQQSIFYISNGNMKTKNPHLELLPDN